MLPSALYIYTSSRQPSLRLAQPNLPCGPGASEPCRLHGHLASQTTGILCPIGLWLCFAPRRPAAAAAAGPSRFPVEMCPLYNVKERKETTHACRAMRGGRSRPVDLISLARTRTPTTAAAAAAAAGWLPSWSFPHPAHPNAHHRSA